jgi:hypothetical protein
VPLILYADNIEFWPRVGLFMGIPWVHFFVTITIPMNSLTLTGIGVDLYKISVVLQDNHGTISTCSEISKVGYTVYSNKQSSSSN